MIQLVLERKIKEVFANLADQDLHMAPLRSMIEDMPRMQQGV
jgi:hypothetical protein